MTNRIYFPNLDGLRFIAFFSVFLYHSGHTEFDYIHQSDWYDLVKRGFFSFGHLGVNFFFVLSGFLITYLLMHEENKTKKIDIPSFYMRRFLRIWPLYFFCLAFGFLFFPFLKSLLGQTPDETANPYLFVSFLSNINNIQNGLPDASILGVLWSVAIEEQFYIFWPLLIIAFRKNRTILFLLIITGSVIFRYFHLNQPEVIFFHTFSVVSDMALGGLLGWASYTKQGMKSYFGNLPKQLIIAFYILGIAAIYLSSRLLPAAAFLVLERVIYGLFFGFIILEQNFATNSFYKIGRNRFLTYWGKYTYGLYCLHFIGILITTNLSKILHTNTSVFNVLVLETIAALAISMLLSWLSYNYFERYFLLLKERFVFKNNNAPAHIPVPEKSISETKWN
jgi:peptidoglycan/LPS O-acetylase OafA/YrhL